MSYGNAITYRMPVGFPGVISRVNVGETIEPEILDPVTPPTAFGRFVKFVNGLIQPLTGGESATDIIGLLVKPYPFQESSANEALGAAIPDPTRPGDILKRGYMSVTVDNGVPAKHGQVYARVTVNGTLAVGNIETGADSGNCVAVAGCFFTGPADANNVTEIEFNL